MSALQNLFARATLWRWPLPLLIIAGFAFSGFAPSLLNGYTQFVLITLGINVILCASLNLVNGYMGEFSVGHAGFMSLGAYTAAIFTTRWSSGDPNIFFPAVLLGASLAELPAAGPHPMVQGPGLATPVGGPGRGSLPVPVIHGREQLRGLVSGCLHDRGERLGLAGHVLQPARAHDRKPHRRGRRLTGAKPGDA